jgi:two-component system chemotaxis sensor kinase CheA
VTSRESEADRARGVEVGANAYIVKSTFDQRELVEAVARLI